MYKTMFYMRVKMCVEQCKKTVKKCDSKKCFWYLIVYMQKSSSRCGDSTKKQSYNQGCSDRTESWEREQNELAEEDSVERENQLQLERERELLETSSILLGCQDQSITTISSNSY